MLEFRLLGPVEVLVAGRPVALGPAKRRAVLAALAVDAGRPVPVDTLIDRVWGAEPPPQARNTLYSHIARIRRLLADVGRELAAAPVRRRSGGYLLDVSPDRVDLLRLCRLQDEARAAAGQAQADLLREALSLWRGEALADVPGAWAEHLRDLVEEQRLTALVCWGSLELAAGNHEAVLAAAGAAAARHPLAEPLIAVQLRALFQAGRTAEALSRYAETRRRTVEELGTEPGPELRALHEALLRGTLDGPPAPQPPRSARVPRQLPAAATTFIGRTSELSGLDQHVQSGRHGDGSAITVVCGTAGVGKTALVVHWAHRSRELFPDGQLFLNLRGYHPDQPMTADDALVHLLTALGVANRDIPLDIDGRIARYRTELSDRRVLVVLDNAATVQQVRPLLPGTGSATVIVTSRDSLSGLVAIDGARRLDLELLPAADAVALLRRLIGPRVDGVSGAARELVELCAGLPLALRVAAERVVSRATTGVPDMVAELRDQQRRLDLLSTDDDPHAAVRSVFSWSLQHLPAEATQCFRLLGLHPGPDVERHALTSLTGLGPLADGAVERLCRAHLVQRTGPGRFGMHDLLRAYAVDLAGTVDGPEGCTAAVGHLLDYYAAAAAAAMDLLYPAEAHRRPRPPTASSALPELRGEEDARTWLDGERQCLVMAIGHAAAHGWPEHTIRLAATLDRYFDGGRSLDALTVHSYALRAAKEVHDVVAEAHALRGLGTAHLQIGNYGPAEEYLLRALDLMRSAGDQIGRARVLTNLAIVEHRRGRFESAAARLEYTLAFYRSTGDKLGESIALSNLGNVYRRMGRYDLAVIRLRRAVALKRRIGDLNGLARALNNLGLAEENLGRAESALASFQQALALFREHGPPHGEAHALESLGTAQLHNGRPEDARRYLEQALEIFRRVGDRDGEAHALNGLGEAAAAAGDHSAAQERHAEAMSVAALVGADGQRARALAGLARVHDALGDRRRAHDDLELALALYDELRAPEAAAVRRDLARLQATAGSAPDPPAASDQSGTRR